MLVRRYLLVPVTGLLSEPDPPIGGLSQITDQAIKSPSSGRDKVRNDVIAGLIGAILPPPAKALDVGEVRRMTGGNMNHARLQILRVDLGG